MPFFDFRCKRCDTVFNVLATNEEREKGLIPCPGCGSRDLERVWEKASFSVASRRACFEESGACKCCQKDCPNAGEGKGGRA